MNEATDKYKLSGGMKGMVRRLLFDRLDAEDLAGLDEPLTPSDVINEVAWSYEEETDDLLLRLYRSPVNTASELQAMMEKAAEDCIRRVANFTIDD